MVETFPGLPRHDGQGNWRVEWIFLIVNNLRYLTSLKMEGLLSVIN